MDKNRLTVHTWIIFSVVSAGFVILTYNFSARLYELSCEKTKTKNHMFNIGKCPNCLPKFCDASHLQNPGLRPEIELATKKMPNVLINVDENRTKDRETWRDLACLLTNFR